MRPIPITLLEKNKKKSSASIIDIINLICTQKLNVYTAHTCARTNFLTLTSRQKTTND